MPDSTQMERGKLLLMKKERPYALLAFAALSRGEQKNSYFDGLQFANGRLREQPLPPTSFVGFRTEAGHGERLCAGTVKDRSPAANIDGDCALISFKGMPITSVDANHQALEVARREISGLAVERAAVINDFECLQNRAFLDMVEFDRFIWGLV